MSLTDFLNDGAALPAGQAIKSLTSQTILPDWYTNYAMQLMANQQEITSRPYTTYQAPRVADFTAQQQQGFDMTGQVAGAYQPGLNAAQQATTNVLNAPGALEAAQPYFTRANATSVDNIGQYMNPYTDQVVNRIAELGTRNLSENIMPALEGRYIQAGQMGFGGTPSGFRTDTARAIRDTSADILGQQTQALQQGYTQAMNASSADLGRFGALGTAVGNMVGTDRTTTANTAANLANLAGLQQSLGLTGAGALQQVGAQQQDLNQQNLDIAYGDFLRQQGWDQQQINSALGTMGALAQAVPTATTEEGLVPSGVAAQYEPSTAATIFGALSGIGGILDAAGVFG